MSRLNKSSQLSSSAIDDDQIELDDRTFKNENDQKTKYLLDQNTKKSKKKNLIVKFDQSNESSFEKMSKFKNFIFLIILFLSILITFLLTRYLIPSTENLKYDYDKELNLNDDLPKNQTKVYRLPFNIMPIHYNIKLQPFMNSDQSYFNGTVHIIVNCEKSTNEIKLNANELLIDNQQVAIYSIDDQKSIKYKIINFEFKNEVVTLKLDNYLIKGDNYTIYMQFKGNLTTSLSGFYRSSYLDSKTSEIKSIGLTQFQATDARRAFPCFDEPKFKSTFNLTIIHFKNMTAIGNMPIYAEESIDNDWISSKFKKTVIMSTYLIAFAVGEFDFKNNYDGKIKYRIITRPNEIETAKEAIAFTPKIVEHYENYFGIKFPLPKLDQLAAPDFSAGAMENFGLIIYREAYLLYDKKVSSVVQLYRIYSVIAHEVVHHWFGNLATPSWWNDLWLNEGFATYMSYEGLDAVKPEWNVWDLFVLDEIHDVLNLDSLKNSHPISVGELNDPSEISEIFDHISYSKSASIIRMLTYIIGIETFNEGVHNFLKAFSYSNAEQADLWRHLQLAADKQKNLVEKINIKEMMNSWTLVVGYPLITIIRNYTSGIIRFSQQKFELNSNNSNKDILYRIQYEVPITYTFKSESDWNPNIKFWLHRSKNKTESFTNQQLNIPKDDWLIANIKQIGYYRVTYDDNNWNLIINQLLVDHTKIERINRVQILDDLFNLARNGVVKYKLALKALTYLKNEKDDIVWTSIGQLTYLINQMLRRTDIFGSWQQFLKNLILPAYKKFELNEIKDDDLQSSYMQKSIVSIACAYNLESCVRKAKLMFNQFMDNVNKNLTIDNHIPANIRSAVYCSAIFHGDELEWNFLFRLYLKEQNANEGSSLLSALTCTRVPWLIVRYLKWMFDESSGIKTQDGIFLFKGIAHNNYGKDIAFNYLRENWESIYRIHGTAMSFAHIIKSLDSINSQFELSLIKDFYRNVSSKGKVGSAKRAFLQTIEQITSNIVWMEKYEKEIAEFLIENEQQNNF